MGFLASLLALDCRTIIMFHANVQVHGTRDKWSICMCSSLSETDISFVVWSPTPLTPQLFPDNLHRIWHIDVWRGGVAYWMMWAVGRSFWTCMERNTTFSPSTSLPVMGEITGVNTASLGGYLHSSKTRDRRADGFHDEPNGHVFDLERDVLRQVLPCPWLTV